MLQHHHTKHQIVSLEELLRPKEKDINNNLNNLNNNSPTIPIIETTDAEDSEGDVKKEPIRVCVRIRPLNAKERKRGDDTVIDYDKISISNQFNPKVFKQKANTRDRSFTFDMCFGPKSSQDDVFSESGITNLLKYAIDGYSSTIFAYGQTGCGKTFTILGEEDSPGILPRSSMYIFDYINHLTSTSDDAGSIDVKLRVSCLEIYQETVNDLLNPTSKNLPVRWSNRDGFFVENLCVVEVDNLDELTAVFNEGISNRKVASHELNKDSSRSHSIFTIQFEITSVDGVDGFESKKLGSIRFVDLAGSEKLKVSKSKSASETSSINKSLLTLGKVISALSSPKKDNPYVPYRDSKLTKLLMDALGGEAKTLMIGCITPSLHYAEETHKTLTYASRVKKIKNIPITKIDPKEKYIIKLKDEIKNLRDELAQYKSRISPTPGKSNIRPDIRPAVIEFPTVERRRVSAKPTDVSEPLFDKLPMIEKKNIAVKVDEQLRASTAMTRIIEMNESSREEEEEETKRREINLSIQSLKSLLEEERELNLEKIPQLKAKISLLSEDNQRWKRIVKRNMEFDAEEYDKLKLENKLLKKFIEEKGFPLPIQETKPNTPPQYYEEDLDQDSLSDREGKDSRMSDISEMDNSESPIKDGQSTKSTINVFERTLN